MRRQVSSTGRSAALRSRSLSLHRFHYLKYALAALLIFIGSEIFVSDFLLSGGKMPAWVRLGVTFA